jgi:hypothetical protein
MVRPPQIVTRAEALSPSVSQLGAAVPNSEYKIQKLPNKIISEKPTAEILAPMLFRFTSGPMDLTPEITRTAKAPPKRIFLLP